MKLQELLWPQGVICLVCGGLSRGAQLCPECSGKLDKLRLEQHNAGKAALFAASVWMHRDEARELVHALKYNAVAAAAQPLAQSMAALAREMNLPPDTVLTWVPMPEKRRLERGIDHGQRLAEGLARLLSLPVQPLMRRRDNRFGTPQEGLSRTRRLTNLQHAFLSLGPVEHPVLLVDDVLTTGATAHACAECLLEAGAPQVQVITATQAAFRYSAEPNHETKKDTQSDWEETP